MRLHLHPYDIGPDRFSWAAARSTDGGRSWVGDFLKIEARRVGPPRAVAPLTPPRNATASASGAR